MDEKKKNNKIYSKLIHDRGKLWSFSKVNTYNLCPYASFLSKKIPKEHKLENIYSKSGTLSHGILEKHYVDKIFKNKEEMLEEFNAGMLDIFTKGYKFKNTKTEINYMANMRLYFESFISDEFIKECETFVSMPLQIFDKKLIDNYLQGWCDAILVKDNIISIGDFKSSTIYRGKDLIEKSRQLILYAMAYEHCYKRKVGSVFFDFMKYCKIVYKNQKGKIKETIIERKDLFLYDNIISVDKAYVFVDLDNSVKNNTIKWFIDTVHKYKSDNKWEKGSMCGENAYYCNVLCSCKKYCKYMGNELPDFNKIN